MPATILSSRQKIIGGMFGEDDLPGRKEGLASVLPPHRKRMFYAAARCGLRAVALSDAINRIWLPSYLCEAMIGGLAGIGRPIAFYPVDQSLQAPDLTWVSSLGSKDLVVAIAYFGAPPGRDLLAAVKSRSARVLLDAAAMPPNADHHDAVDAVLYSPRKLAGLPDGGIVLDLSGRLGELPEAVDAPPEWMALAEQAFRARVEFDRAGANSDDRSWYRIQLEWERRFPPGIWSMSSRSREMLDHGIAWSEIASRRRTNHDVLATLLEPHGLCSFAERSACPLGYATVFDNEGTRDAVRAALIAGLVYPPVHWNSPAAVPLEFRESRDLAQRILTLPCDQRYSAADMRRIASIVLTTLRGLHLGESA